MKTTVRAAVGYLRSLLVQPQTKDEADRNLLERFRAANDGEAFAQLVRRHGPKVFAVARQVGGEVHLAEDVFQATFLLLARRAHAIRRAEALGSWLSRTAFRIALRARRSRDRRSSVESHVLPPANRGPLDELSGREILAVLDEELKQLPDRVRWPLVLCCLEGLSQEEAARVIGCSPGAVRGRLERGRVRLRQRLLVRGLTLPAVLAAVFAFKKTSSAASPTLREATVKVVLHGGASPSVHALLQGATTMLSLGQLKAIVLGVLLVGALGAGVMAWPHPGEPKPQDAPPPAPPKAKTDSHGDPLPDGAVARMGSMRFRQAGLRQFLFQDEGKTLATIGRDKVIRYWDAATGRESRSTPLQGAAATPGYFVISDDGKLLAVETKEAVLICDAGSGKELKKIPAPKDGVYHVFFSPDGKTLAVSTPKWRFHLYEWESGKERQLELPLKDPKNVQYNTDSTYHGAYSPDGKWFVAGAQSNHPLGVYEAATGKEVYRLDCHAQTSAVSPDGKRLVVSGWEDDMGKTKHHLTVFDLETGKEAARIALEDDEYYYNLAFSPDGKSLACAFSDRSCVRDVATGRVLFRMTQRPIQAAFSPDGKTLVASSSFHLRLWDVATGKERNERPGQFGYNPVLAVSPDGKTLASADWMNREVSLWDAGTGRLLRQLPLKEDDARYVRNVTFSADGRTINAGQHKGFLPSWDVASGKELGTTRLDDPDQPDRQFTYFYEVFSRPSGKSVVTLERVLRPKESTRLAVWDAGTGKILHQHLFPGEVKKAAWLKDGELVALQLREGLALVETETGTIRFQNAGTPANGPVSASPDERLVACPKGDGKAVGVWESATGKEVAAVETGKVVHLALAADGRSLVTADADFLRVWDLATGKERKRWPLPTRGLDTSGQTFVLALALSPDGRRAFTSLIDGTALVWDLEPALKRAEPLVKVSGEQEVAAWWADLASDDAGKAYAAAWRLAEAPEDKVMALLRRHLKPAAEPDRQVVQKLVADMDSDSFEVREKAFKELEKLSIPAIPLMKEILKENPSAEVRRRLETLTSRTADPSRSPELLRRLRAIQVLERIASKEARRLLTELAEGVAVAPETREAKAARDRLTSPSSPP